MKYILTIQKTPPHYAAWKINNQTINHTHIAVCQKPLIRISVCRIGKLTMTMESIWTWKVIGNLPEGILCRITHGAITLSRMNFSEHVGHVIIFSWIPTTACCLVVEIFVGLWLDKVYSLLVVMHMYLHYFPLSLPLSLSEQHTSNVTRSDISSVVQYLHSVNSWPTSRCFKNRYSAPWQPQQCWRRQYI